MPTLTKVYAQVLTAGIRLRNEKVFEAVEQPDGSIVEEQVGVNHIDATPGQVIDVTGWHNLQAYVERGQIMLMSVEQAIAHESALADESGEASGADDSASQATSDASDADPGTDQPPAPDTPAQSDSGANRNRRKR